MAQLLWEDANSDSYRIQISLIWRNILRLRNSTTSVDPDQPAYLHTLLLWLHLGLQGKRGMQAYLGLH